MKLDFGKSVAAAAAAGLMGVACGGSTAEPVSAESGSDAPTATGEKACCKGLNECSGKGGCQTATHTCAGKNSCRGKGGCNMHCPQ